MKYTEYKFTHATPVCLLNPPLAIRTGDRFGLRYKYEPAQAAYEYFVYAHANKTEARVTQGTYYKLQERGTAL